MASPELLAIVGIIGVHLIPKALQRLRIPAPVTALLLGAVFALFAPTVSKDSTLYLASTLGIASLFLFAGLSVDVEELGRDPKILIGTLVVHAAILVAVAVVGALGLGLEVKSAMLLSLAVVTPSGGFILDGLSGLGATPRERDAIRDSALTCEILSLVIFFFVMQSTSARVLVTGTISVTLLLLFVPILLRGLARVILPYAPNSEFALLVLTAVICAYATRKLGIYYLLGAFAVGVVARRLEDEVPALAAEGNQRAIELFATFFAPFYFAHAGMQIDGSAIRWRAIGLALALMLVMVPIRIVAIAAVRRAASEPMRAGARVGAAVVPTFVFSLVMAQMLARTTAPTWIAGGLVLFAIFNSFVPQLVFRWINAPAELATPEPPTPASGSDESASPDATTTVTAPQQSSPRPEPSGDRDDSQAAPSEPETVTPPDDRRESEPS